MLPRGRQCDILFVWFVSASFLVIAVPANDCVARDFGHGSIVCVCNATYCDFAPIPDPEVPEGRTFYWYVSTKDGRRMSMRRGSFEEGRLPSGVRTVTVNRDRKYQTMEGWGAAFTDSAGMNIMSLSQRAREQLMRSYFGAEGSRYTLGRVPVAGCDFSTRPYTYDDVSDDDRLERFRLEREDVAYKIPLMKWALALRPELRFLSAAWSAPPWMKTNDAYNGIGFLKVIHYQRYADYLLKFIDAYQRHGVPIWALSTGNEPSNALLPFIRINSMGWMPWTLDRWIADHLGPTLANSTYNRTMILALDDQRFLLPWYVDLLFRNRKARTYCSGIAVHMYWDRFVPAIVLDETHRRYPEQILLMTEASIGDVEDVKVLLGSWERGERYILNIIQNVNHWMSAWVDWNLALDETGGPNWIGNYVDAAIIVNATSDEFYKQPMYYAIQHVSRFVDRNSVRIDVASHDDVPSVAFLTPRGAIVVVLCNSAERETNVAIKDTRRGFLRLRLPPRSIHTLVYRQ